VLRQEVGGQRRSVGVEVVRPWLRRVARIVRCSECQVAEVRRCIVVRAQELDRAVGEELAGVLGRRALGAKLTRLEVADGHERVIAHPAEHDVPRALERACERAATVVPLARGEGRVTGGAERLAEGPRASEVILVDAEVRAARVQHRAARDAHRAVGRAHAVRAVERRPAPREGVEVRRPCRGVAGETQGVRAQVVGEDEEHVRTGVGRTGRILVRADSGSRLLARRARQRRAEAQEEHGDGCGPRPERGRIEHSDAKHGGAARVVTHRRRG
jgi:hypothetical protein